MNIGDFIMIEAGGSWNGTDLIIDDDSGTLFIGQGPGLIDGEVNPAARGFLVTNVSLHARKIGQQHAMYASGTLQILGIPDITLAANSVEVSVNTTGQQQVLDFGDGDVANDQSISANTKSLSGNDITIDLLGQLLHIPDTGNLSISYTAAENASELQVSVSDAVLLLGTDCDTPSDYANCTFVAENIDGDMLMSDSGIAGDLTIGQIELATDAVNLHGAVIGLRVNTGSTAVDHDADIATTPIPAGPYVRVDITLSLIHISEPTRPY